MRWGDAKTYAWLHKASLTDQYRNMLMFWLQHENPTLHRMVLKEIGHAPSPKSDPTGHGNRKGNPDPAEEKGRRQAAYGADNHGEKDAGW